MHEDSKLIINSHILQNQMFRYLTILRFHFKTLKIWILLKKICLSDIRRNNDKLLTIINHFMIFLI